MQAARHLVFALLVFACLLFAGTVLEILFCLCVLWGVSAFGRMVTGSPVSNPEIEAELSRLAQISRRHGQPLPLVQLATTARPDLAA